MERLPLASSKSLVPSPPAPFQVQRQPLLPSFLPASAFGRTASRRVRFRVSAHGRRSGCEPSQRFSVNGPKQVFASTSCSSNSGMSSIGTPQFLIPPPLMSIGSPLICIGVGFGLSALFSWVTLHLKYAMKCAMDCIIWMDDWGNIDSSSSGFFPSSPYPFPSSSLPPPPAPSPAPDTSQPVTTIDVPSAKVEATTFTEVRNDTDKTSEGPKRYGKAASVISVDPLEKMMEDPTVQNMVYLYLPEEMRNSTTFKWMLQNPQYRQQLQDMLNNIGGGSDWDNRMMDLLKNFDLSSPDAKQQFDQIGLTPEEVISKIMANSEMALAFQNSKVQAAIMD